MECGVPPSFSGTSGEEDEGGARGPEEGSELVSHVLVQILVMAVVLALLQLAFALHTRNMAIAAAGEGARLGALVGASDADAIERTDSLLSGLSGVRERSITTSRRDLGGREVLVVTVRTSLPVLVSFGPTWLTVRGSSLVEGES